MIGLQAGAEVPIHDTSGVKRWGLRVAADFDIQLARYNSDGEFQELVLTIDNATGALSGIDLAAGEIATADIADGAITPVKESSGYRAPSADAALTLAVTDRTIRLNSTTGAKAATMTAGVPGQVIMLHVGTLSGGSYTLAVTGGTITLDAVREGAIIGYSGSAWELVALTGGSTFA